MKIFKIFRRHVIVSRFELDYIVSEYKRQRLINKHLYKNISAQPNYIFDGNDVATGYEIFKTYCVFLLKTSMPALNFVFSDNLIL